MKMTVVVQPVWALVFFMGLYSPMVHSATGIIMDVLVPDSIIVRCGNELKHVNPDDLKGQAVLCKHNRCKLLSGRSKLINCVLESQDVPLQDNLVFSTERPLIVPKCTVSKNQIADVSGMPGATSCVYDDEEE